MKEHSLSYRHWTIILAAFVFVMLPGLDHGIWRPDEPYVAGISSGMARTHDFVTPLLNGRPFLEKPPLYYAVAGLSGMVFGPADDVSYRLASILFSVLTLAAVFFFLRRRVGSRTALIADLVLATLWEYFRISRWILVDIALVFGVTLAMLAWMRLAEGDRPKTSALIFGLATAVAFLAKGMVGPGIIAAAVLIDIIRRRDIRLLYKSRPDIMLICMLLPVAAWVAALWSRGGWPYAREVLVVNNLMRFTGAAEAVALGHQHGLFYYFGSLPGILMPWTLIFIPALALAIRRFREEPALSWLIGPFILLSIASTKRSLYLAPLLPACAIMIAAWLNEPAKAKWERVILSITWGLVIAGAVAPLAGIFLGQPVIGLVAGMLAIGALVLIDRDPELRRSSLALALCLCFAMSASMMVFYKYRQPQEDYLPITKQALALTGKNQLSIIADDEIFEGVLPMLTGHVVENIPAVDQIKIPGYYLWSDDKHESTITQVKSLHPYKLLLDKPIGHNRKIRLAYIDPGAGGPKDGASSGSRGRR